MENKENMMKNKVVLITGAAMGLGEAMAKRFSKEGAIVIMADYNKDALLKASQKVKGSIALVGDVSKEEDCERFVREAVSQGGLNRLDVLCNNAGICPVMAPSGEYPTNEWRRTMAINLDGVFFMQRAALHQMEKQGGSGSNIINVSSIAGLGGFANLCPYAAAKHAVIGLTKTAAVEYAKKGIRVNAICPGVVNTPMVENIVKGMDAEAANGFQNMHPIPGMIERDYIANAVYFLASDESKFTTGIAFPVDAGYTAA